MQQDSNQILSTAFVTTNFTVITGIIDAITLLLPVVLSHSRWIHNSLLPQQVPLFQHHFSFTKEVDIPRNSMVEGCLLKNKTTLLPLTGIIVNNGAVRFLRWHLFLYLHFEFFFIHVGNVFSTLIP